MVLYIPTDIASRFVEEFIRTHYMAFEVGVAFGKFFVVEINGSDFGFPSSSINDSNGTMLVVPLEDVFAV